MRKWEFWLGTVKKEELSPLFPVECLRVCGMLEEKGCVWHGLFLNRLYAVIICIGAL